METAAISGPEVAAVRLCVRLDPLSLVPALEVEEHQHGLVIFLGIGKTGESTLGVKRLRLTKSIDSDITAAGLPLLVVPGLDEEKNVFSDSGTLLLAIHSKTTNLQRRIG